MVILRSAGWLPLALLLLTGCQAASGPLQADPPEPSISLVRSETEAPVLTATVRTVPTSAYSQTLRDRLAAEWSRYAQSTLMERTLSSHLWGTCTSNFYSWAAAEDFVGFPIKNPLEGQDWLMTQYNFGGVGEDAERFPVEVNYQGPDRDTVDHVSLQAQYLAGEVRIQFFVWVYAENPVTLTEAGEIHSAAFLEDEKGIVFGLEEQGGYVSRTAYLVDEHLLYTVYTVGEAEQSAAVEKTMDKLLALF